ncbi:MAG: PQQ-binding-like beta-propeller repeat protein, partial [Acidobacteriota bacterium]
TLVLTAALALATSGGVAASAAATPEWPQYRGPDRNGLSAETGLARSWSEAGPKELWRRPIGAAFSGVVVAKGALYTTTSDDGGDYLVRLAAEDGETVWRTRLAPQYVENFGNGPRSTPTVDGDRVFALSGDGHLVAVARDDGEVLWRRDLRGEYSIEPPSWGFASAPLVLGGDLILDLGAPGAGVVAFRKDTGEVRWTAGDGGSAYGSPAVIEAGGQRQLLLLRRAGLLALTPEGEELWSHDWAPNGGIKPAIPIFVPPDLVVASASYGIGALAVRLVEGNGGALRTEEVWRSQVMRNHFNSAVLLDGKVYGFDNATLKALDPATGDALWAQRRGLGKGSLIYADGMLIVLTENGTLKLVEATPEAYAELASHPILEGRCWTEPTLAAGRLYLRNREEIVALDLRSDATSAGEATTAGSEAPAQASKAGTPKAPASDPGAAKGEVVGPLTLAKIVELHRRSANAVSPETGTGLRLTGIAEGEGLRVPFTLTLAWPDRFRLEIAEERGVGIWAHDGEASWSVDPFSEQSKVLEAEEAAILEEDLASFLTPWLPKLGDGPRLEWMGTAELDDGPAHHLRMHLEDGRFQDWYLDGETFLVRRRDVAAISPWWGEYTRVYWYHRSDPHLGAQLPVFVERIDETFVKLFEVETVERLDAVDGALFAVPPDLRGTEADEGDGGP